MVLIEDNDNFLGYRCLEKPEAHNFRYNINQKKWEKLIIKTQMVLNYNKNPCQESIIKTPNFANDSEKKLIEDQFQGIVSISSLTEIKGIGLKRAEELELAGIKTVTDLAKRSPQHLAEKTGIPITQISNWIIEANKLTKRPVKICS
jgi:predicted flap endonuclease-1-like 5' DNA nuclease